MTRFENVISELEYQIKCHLAAEMLGLDLEEDPEVNNSLLREWNAAIEVLKANQ